VLSRRFGGQKEARDHAGRRETVTQIPKGA
jgi:hypothetical protein